MDMQEPEEIPFGEVLDALRNTDEPFYPRYLYRLSDLEAEELEAFTAAWPQVELRRRQAVMEDVEEIGEDDYLVNFEPLCRCVLPDEDARVRELAVRALWEYEDEELVPIFLELLQQDPDATVQAASAGALSKYVYLGEIEELEPETLDEIVDSLIAVHNQASNTLVRRRALEAVGFSSRPEVPGLIEAAYYSGSEDWICSAVFAMGRSANARWGKMVLAMLDNDAAAIRFEAARAAGELELKTSREQLFELVDDTDEDVRMAALWSLSQLGGEGVAELLDELFEETEDDEERELIEAAIDNLAFTEEMESFSLLELDEDDLDEEFFDEEFLDDEEDDEEFEDEED